MLIETSTINDNTMNFFPPMKIMREGQREFVDRKSMRKSPLAERLFDLSDIASILITPESISVTKSGNTAWKDLKPLILAEIMDYFSTGEAVMIENPAQSEDETVKRIIGIIEARIRPAIQQDNGDISFIRFEKGVVYVELKGNCVGCPYALVTLKDGVEKLLKAYIPEVIAVENFTPEE